MACRKQADRALMQLGEWLQEQDEKNEAKYQSLVEEQWQLWFPQTHQHLHNIAKNVAEFEEAYCVKWLAKGPEVPGGGNFSGGCSGGCGKAHPRVVLDYITDNGGGYTVATISHPLRPFQAYFETMVQEGRACAIQVDDNNYCNNETTATATRNQDDHSNSNPNPNPNLAYKYKLVTGFLPNHLEALKAQFPTQHHLIKVASHDALAISTTAYRNHLLWQEQEARAKKRQRTIAGPAASQPLLEQALQICLDTHSLLDHLDLVDIACMRCTNRVMRNMAQTMISTRMQHLKLSVTVLGPKEGETDGDQDESETKKILLNEIGRRGYYSVKCSQEPLVVSRNNKTDKDDDAGACSFQFQPKEPAACESRWSYREKVIMRGTVNNTNHNDNDRARARDHHIVQLYLHDHDDGDDNGEGEGKKDDDNTSPRLVESHTLFDHKSKRPPFFLEVARFRINRYLYQPGTGSVTVTCDQMIGPLTCQVTLHVHPDEPLLETTNDYTIIRRSGTLSIQNIPYAFEDLLGVYVRKQLPVAKQKLAELRQQRPLLKQEREYVKLLARMARNAPGNATAFTGLEGWP